MNLIYMNFLQLPVISSLFAQNIKPSTLLSHITNMSFFWNKEHFKPLQVTRKIMVQ